MTAEYDASREPRKITIDKDGIYRFEKIDPSDNIFPAGKPIQLPIILSTEKG